MKTKTRRTNWQALARSLAMDAHENHFDSRRGLWYLEDVDAICLYDNNPYQLHPELCDREIAEFRRRLADRGTPELAFATYPPPGDDQPGYTYAMIIDAREDMSDWVADTMQEILWESWGSVRHDGKGRDRKPSDG